METSFSNISNPARHETTTSHIHTQHANTYPPGNKPLKSPTPENRETPKGNIAGLDILGDVDVSDPEITQVNQSVSDSDSTGLVTARPGSIESGSLKGQFEESTRRGFEESRENEEKDTMDFKDYPHSDAQPREDADPNGSLDPDKGLTQTGSIETSMSGDMIASTGLDRQFDESTDNGIDESLKYEASQAIDVSEVPQSIVQHFEEADLDGVHEGDAELTETDSKEISLSDDTIASTWSDEEEHIGAVTEFIEVTDVRESTPDAFDDSGVNSINALEAVDSTHDIDEGISHLEIEKELLEVVVSPEGVTEVGVLQLGFDKDFLEVSESNIMHQHCQYLIPMITGFIYFLFIMKRRGGIKSNCCCGSFFQQRKPSRISENAFPKRDYRGLVEGLRTVQEGLSSYRTDRALVDHELGETSKQILDSITTQVPDDLIEPTGPPTARRRGQDIDLR